MRHPTQQKQCKEINATSTNDMAAPFRKRAFPLFKRCSQKEMALPKATTGCGNQTGSPSQWSSNHAVSNGRFRLKAIPNMMIISSISIFPSFIHYKSELINFAIAATSLSFSSGVCVAIRKNCSFSPVKLEASRMRIPCSPAR